MDERTRKMIEEYVPHDPDPTLAPGEYYYKQETMGGERIIRVQLRDILPHHDGTEYGIYQDRGGRLCRVDVGYGDDWSRGVRMGRLYDNRQDCKDDTHWWYDEWERLRAAQREKDGNAGG